MDFFFQDNKKPDICLVFCGWGTDEKLYLPVLKDMNYLLFFNYDKNPDLKLPLNLNSFDKKYLLSYSAGGIMPAIFKDKLPAFDISVAVNASVRLFGRFGLSKEIVDKIKSLNLDNYIDFRKNYLVSSGEELELFNKNQPSRSFKSCFFELDNLEYIAEKYDNVNYDYDRVFVAQKDKMLTLERQKEFFGNKVRVIEGGHFPFYLYNSLAYFFIQ